MAAVPDVIPILGHINIILATCIIWKFYIYIYIYTHIVFIWHRKNTFNILPKRYAVSDYTHYNLVCRGLDLFTISQNIMLAHYLHKMILIVPGKYKLVGICQKTVDKCRKIQNSVTLVKCAW